MFSAIHGSIIQIPTVSSTFTRIGLIQTSMSTATGFPELKIDLTMFAHSFSSVTTRVLESTSDLLASRVSLLSVDFDVSRTLVLCLLLFVRWERLLEGCNRKTLWNVLKDGNCLTNIITYQYISSQPFKKFSIGS